MSDRVQITVTNGIADVRFNRPAKHNALDAEQFDSVTRAAMSLQDRNDVRVVVVSGNGPSFCSGLDYGSFVASDGGINVAFERDGVEPANNAQSCAYAWRKLPMPVIAAIHGNALGGGFQIAMGADIRIAKADARFSILEIDYGLIPDMGITQTLRRTVPLDVLKELTFSGRFFDGNEALKLGVVTRVEEDPLAAALAMAEQIASRSPDAIRGAKRLFEESWDDGTAAGFALEEGIQKEIMAKPNQMEAVMAKFEKRAPKFAD